jgi:hypothetical protein
MSERKVQETYDLLRIAVLPSVSPDAKPTLPEMPHPPRAAPPLGRVVVRSDLLHGLDARRGHSPRLGL